MGSPREFRPPRGFNIIELMITVLIVSILTMIALPAFTQFLRRMQVSQVKNDLISDINFAKAEAAKRGYPVGIYAFSNSLNWTTGWTVWADTNVDGTLSGAAPDTQLRQHDALTNGYTLKTNLPRGNTAPLMFNAQGTVQLPANPPIYFVACNPNNVAADARSIQITGSGAILAINGIPAASGLSCP